MNMDDIDYHLEKQAEELTSCSICTNKFFDEDDEGVVRIPKILECMHTFCDKCIARHFEEVNSKRISPVSNFPCPTCRKTIYVPLKGIKDFPTDLRVKQIIELLKTTKNFKLGTTANSLSPHSLCQTCRFKGLKEEGNFLCLTCQKAFCSKCRKMHQETSIFANHSFYNLKGDNKKKQNNSVECIVHSTDLEYFCRTCNKHLCCICTMMPEHTNHKFVPSNDEIYETIAEESQDFITTGQLAEQSNNESISTPKLQHLLTTLAQQKDELHEMIKCHEKLKESFQNTQDAVKRAYKEAQEKLKKQYEDLTGSLKTSESNFAKFNAKKEEIVDIIKKADKIQVEVKKNQYKNVQPNIEKIEKLLSNITSLGSFPLLEAGQANCSFTPDVKVHLGQILLVSEDNGSTTSVYESSTNPFKKLFRQKAPRRSSDISNDNRRFSSVSQSDGPDKSSNGELLSTRLDALLKSLRCKSLSRKSKVPTVCKDGVRNDMWYGMLHWFTDSLRGLKNICFAENGDILIVVDETCPEIHNQLLAFRSTDGNGVNMIIEDKWDSLEKIKNLCYNNDNKQLYVLGYKSEEGMVKKFKLQFDRKTIKCDLRCVETIKLASLTNPIAIAVSKKLIAILEEGGTKITLFNSKFERVSSLGEGDFNKTFYLTIDREDRILLSDFLKREIKIFKNDEMVLKFSSTGPRGEELLAQGIVTVSKQNNILVADQALNSVSLYNADGSLLDVIVETLEKPWGLCYSEAKHLLAVSTDKALRVFKL